MHLPANFSFGLPSVPRQTMPSMFQILKWDEKQKAQKAVIPQNQIVTQQEKIQAQVQLKEINQNTQQVASPSKKSVQNKSPEKAKENSIQQVPVDNTNNVKPTQNLLQASAIQKPKAENIIENTSFAKSQYQKYDRKKRSKSVNTKYQLYEYTKPQLKRSQSQRQSNYNTVGSKIVSQRVIKSVKKLDPNNSQDRKQIQKRVNRIKQFERVTRDLPNSAWNTYYGRPPFQAYGRASSVTQLLSHNVMPHKGGNNPKDIQTYYTALLKGKTAKTKEHIPRNPVQDQVQSVPEAKQKNIHLESQKPDLINNPRFATVDPKDKKDNKIPSNKYTPLSDRKAKKTNKQKKKKTTTSQLIAGGDGLKYLNIRQKLLQQLEAKKLNASKLAWKVTQCYPVQWQNQQRMRQSNIQWEKIPIAGKASTVCEKVGELFRPLEKPDNS